MNDRDSIPRRSLATWRRLRTDFQEFLALETAGSVFLIAATVAALIVANSALHAGYESFLHAEIRVGVGSWHYSLSVAHFINDGLMALFFFVIGLEIKREMVAGELSTTRKAALPVIAALGGMIAPALIYLTLNAGGPGASGWGIPMATDIAFALGALALLGKRAPAGIRLFLTALAIADDLGAILVIAIVYSSGVVFGWLAAALGVLAVLVVLNVRRVDSPAPYALLGLLVWFAFLNSGVHATIAGVLVAMTIPTRSRLRPTEFIESAREKLDEIESVDVPGAHVLEDDRQQEAAFEIRRLATHSAAPLQRLEHALHPWTTFFVLPLFAFANAGVRIVGFDAAALLAEPVALGIFFGLVVGKPVGITAASWLAVRLRISELPAGVGWKHIVGAGILGGIGFTMSLFITNLAFTDDTLVSQAKLAILVTSSVAGILGYVYLRMIAEKRAATAS